MSGNHDSLQPGDQLPSRVKIEIPFTAEGAIAVMEQKRQSVLIGNLYEYTHAVGERVNPGGEVNYLLMEIAYWDLEDQPYQEGVVGKSREVRTADRLARSLDIQKILVKREPADLVEEEVMLLMEIQGAYHLLAWRVLNASDLNSETKTLFSTADEHLSPTAVSGAIWKTQKFFEANPDLDRPLTFSEQMRASVRSIYNRHQALFDFYNRHPERFEITEATQSERDAYGLLFGLSVNGHNSFRREALIHGFIEKFSDPECATVIVY